LLSATRSVGVISYEKLKYAFLSDVLQLTTMKWLHLTSRPDIRLVVVLDKQRQTSSSSSSSPSSA